MRCKFCKNRAIYSELRLCETHFNQFYEKKVKTYLEKYNIKNKKILIAVSGGKDSSSLAFVLNNLKEEFNLKLELFFLNHGIKGYSENCLNTVSLLSNTLNLKLNILDMKKVYGKTIDDFSANKVCSVCGTVKRYLINKFAYENHFDFIATGHNLDDELFFIFNNLFNQSLDYLMKLGPITPTLKEYKLIGRIKPLYYLTEKENAIYAIINKLPFYFGSCPYSKESRQFKLKMKINTLFEKREWKINFVKSINKLKRNHQKLFDGWKLCKKCGYPTTSEICRFCKIMNQTSI